MIDWTLTQRLAALAVVAAAMGVPAQLRAVMTAATRVAATSTTPLPTVLVTAALGVAAAVLGSALAPHVGLSAPILGSRMGEIDAPLLTNHVGAGVLGGIVVAMLLPAYYLVAPRADPELFRVGEAVRIAMGLPARVSIGGILEEIVFRWGALALLAWIGMRLTGGTGPGVRWVSILGAALLFGAGHLPGAAGLSGRLTLGVVAIGFTVNGWLGLVAGWLVWNRGLAAAMVAHTTVHVIWAGFERLRGA